MSERFDVLEAIGGTPLVRLRKVVPKGAAEVWIKLEGFNPTGSYKDRMAVSIVRRSMESGALEPGTDFPGSSEDDDYSELKRASGPGNGHGGANRDLIDRAKQAAPLGPSSGVAGGSPPDQEAGVRVVCEGAGRTPGRVALSERSGSPGRQVGAHVRIE